ncbi:hypothetical protein QTP86_012989 [Hemibagrus guttatus]|nr:hypothetical protein QTP86_012989 [Hemibagrus guttatus]
MAVVVNPGLDRSEPALTSLARLLDQTTRASLLITSPLTAQNVMVDRYGSFRKDRRNLTSMLVQPISTKLAKELLSAPSDGHSQPCVPMKMAPSSGQRIINLSIGSQTSYRRVFNVIGYLRGKINPDKYVLVGARHSSWYEGGLADWSSGAAVISQIIDSLTAQTSAHWQPDRTIVFCSMGGSALGNVGSFEWGEVGCELEEKERFWSELDEVMESIPTGERVVIGADFNGHVGEGNTGDEEVMGKFGVKERNLEGQMVVDFAKRMDMAVVNTYFQKREEHRVTYKSGGRRTQVDYILCRRGNLKEISDCKVVVGESVARQHRMVVCRMTLMVCKTKRSEIEIEKKTKWWKLEKEECCEEFRQKLRQALGGQVVLPDDWETTAEVIRETGRKVLGVSSGRRKEDMETWWWNEEVQDSIQRKRLAKKKWDMDRTEENRQEYKELQRRVKREVSKAKQKAYDKLYTRLDTREGEKDLYRLARQRDRDGKDVQQVRVIKDRDGRVLTSEESVQRRWKEYFEELMNEENEREKRVEGVNSVEQKVDKIRKDEVRKAGSQEDEKWEGSWS